MSAYSLSSSYCTDVAMARTLLSCVLCLCAHYSSPRRRWGRSSWPPLSRPTTLESFPASIISASSLVHCTDDTMARALHSSPLSTGFARAPQLVRRWCRSLCRRWGHSSTTPCSSCQTRRHGHYPRQSPWSGAHCISYLPSSASS